MTLRGKRVLVCGSSELVSIDQIVTPVEDLAGIYRKGRCSPLAPRGASGRSSGIRLIRQRPGWFPSIALSDGVARTCRWIEWEMTQSRRLLCCTGVERYATA